jgi:thiol-disulfide isomerase/thioredoxin
MRRLSVYALAVFALALWTTGCLRMDFFRRPAPATFAKGPAVGSPAPDIEGEDFEGKRFKLSDYRGKVVVVSFWASWCKPCRDLIPHERALAERFRDRKFVLLGANMDSDRGAALKAISVCGVTWRNWRAGGEDNPIQKLWPVELLPTIYVIDAKGTVRYTRLSGPNLDTAVETLLAEMDAKH